MSPNEPKKPPVTRTFPAVDVIFESEQPPPTERSGSQRHATLSSSEVAALRRIVRGEPTSSAPPSRPSLPVRAARGAKDKSPWIVGGMLLVEIIRFVLQSL